MEKLKCIHKGCPNEGRYCRVFWHEKKNTESKETEPKPRSKPDTPKDNTNPFPKKSANKRPISKVSKSRQQENKVYNKLSKRKKKDQPHCQLKIAGVCIDQPVRPHHTEGRTGKNFTDEKKILMSCDPCNKWCVSHPQQAAALGLVISRLKRSDKRGHLYEVKL